MPTYLANSHINNKTLCHILPKWKPDNLKIDALYSSRKNLPLTVRSLIDDLTEYFIKTS